MDFHIGEMNSRVEAMDMNGMLQNPRVRQELVQMLAAEVRRTLAHDRRAADERKLRKSALSDERNSSGLG